MCNTDNKKLIIMCGVAGSGKSYLAHKLCREYPEFQAIVLGSDQYFENTNGEYVFNARELGKAHEWNRERVENCMCMSFAAIFVDNTNTMAREIYPYLKLADKYGYEVEFRVPDTEWAFSPEELFKKNSHGVPLDVIKRMVDRFEHQGDLTDEEFVEKILNFKK